MTDQTQHRTPGHAAATRRRRPIAALLVGASLLATACGSSDAGTSASYEPAGYRRDPAPMVGSFSLPDVTNDNADFAFTAEPGGILVVYFGYTNCPDFCPTTMSDLKLALRRLDEGLADRVEVAMVTVDPDRDLAILGDYVQSFVPGSHALGTTDPAALAAVAAPMGVSYEVTTLDSGEIQVAHSTALYAIDDAGEVVLTWQFGTTIDDLAADLTYLLGEVSA